MHPVRSSFPIYGGREVYDHEVYGHEEGWPPVARRRNPFRDGDDDRREVSLVAV